MALYSCKLGSADGRIIYRELEASEPGALQKSLEEQGFFVFEVKKKPLQFLFDKGLRRRTIDNRSLLTFNQEMLVLIKAAMPIMQVLDTILEKHEGGRLSEVLRQVREDVKGGAALSVAMEKHGRFFPHLYVASIRAGERTGDLPRTIRRYIQYLKRVEAIRKKIVSALFYPVILLVVAFAAITLLLLYVVPTFSQVYAESGSQLPLPTQMLIDFTTFLRRFFLVGVVLAMAGVAVFRSWSSTEKGRFFVDRLKLRIPLLGDLYTKYSVASFTRTLATVLGSGIPIIESLRMSLGTLNNVFMERKLFEAVKLVEAGGRVSAAFERIEIMPPLALRMLGVGETTGALEEMLVDVSDYLEDELAERMNILTTAIEPAVMLVMGLVIGLIIIAMYLPIFKIAGTVG
ncbi:type II secretion system F family protein [Geobacter sp. SVR]|uniref:type II secretion system F family protein n=1 Tax=Geobacter sp. SVR TaxID=2495594 RepID=UPI00143EFB8D|nr:type II secretion system F family protein [Geobacter sp. SVR]BCS53662.1 type II secretion system protein [Geobacter sp. SVR]GCF84141.1 type II secretion system protein [Geobacter sp. SVR]